MLRPPRTVIEAADLFCQRAPAQQQRARLRAQGRCAARDPEVGICYGCHRISGLNDQRMCLRCANRRPHP